LKVDFGNSDCNKSSEVDWEIEKEIRNIICLCWSWFAWSIK